MSTAQRRRRTSCTQVLYWLCQLHVLRVEKNCLPHERTPPPKGVLHLNWVLSTGGLRGRPSDFTNAYKRTTPGSGPKHLSPTLVYTERLAESNFGTSSLPEVLQLKEIHGVSIF